MDASSEPQFEVLEEKGKPGIVSNPAVHLPHLSKDIFKKPLLCFQASNFLM